MKNWQEQLYREINGEEAAEIPDAENKAEKPPIKVSGILKGIAGAFAGALAGSVPWLLAGYFFHNWISVLGFLIPVLSLLCYMLFRGARNSIPAYIICGIFSAAFICFLYFMGYYWMMWSGMLAAEGLAISDVYVDKYIVYCLEKTLIFIKDPGNISDFIIHLSVGLISGFGGMFFMNSRLKAYCEK